MREIGSEFWNVPTTEYDNGVFHNSTQWFLSGRSALQSIIKELVNCKSVCLPSWCCDSIIKPFVDAGKVVSFYPVYFNGNLIQEIALDCDAILIMDYFGYNGSIKVPASYNGVIIRDVTHSIFSNSYNDADYYFGSLRKWCGVWTGGFAWAKDNHQLFMSDLISIEYVDLRKTAMTKKASYITNVESKTDITDKQFLNLFSKAEDLLDDVGEESATERDINTAIHLDVDAMRSKRQANATVLMKALKDWLIFPELIQTDCPMFVPVIVPEGKRNELRQYLIENEIYCPVHWPVSSYHVLDDRERFIYDNELSLVCDQRYDEDDMLRIVESIKDFWKDAK